MPDRYELARDLAEAGDIDGAWKVINQFLHDDPMDYRALVTASYLMRRCSRLAESYHFAKAATQSSYAENDAAPWINLGHAASELWLADEAEACYRRALKCRNIGSGTLRRNTLLNICALYVDNARYAEAKGYALEMLKDDPEDKQGLANLGFCQLAMRDWSGWANYHHTLGSEWRPRVSFKGEPEWDGTPGKTVAVYGDQGIGDEISFASIIPDTILHCKRVILECDPRLQGLFRRSFPEAKVYGTRTKKEIAWAKEDQDFDASLAIGQLGEFYRTSADCFPGTPYLKPCPERTSMWRSLFDGKVTVGIAWRGGTRKSNAKNRQWTLEDLSPLFRGIRARFVSLQYKDASAEIAAFKVRHPKVDIVQYPWATLTQDYDDTAALISSLDYVFTMQTAVAHTAGALGVPVTVCVPVASQWRYGTAEDKIPWYDSMKVIRQAKHGSWHAEIERGARELRKYLDLAGLSGTAGEAARDGSLRERVRILCPDGEPGHRENGGTAPS